MKREHYLLRIFLFPSNISSINHSMDECFIRLVKMGFGLRTAFKQLSAFSKNCTILAGVEPTILALLDHHLSVDFHPFLLMESYLLHLCHKFTCTRGRVKIGIGFSWTCSITLLFCTVLINTLYLIADWSMQLIIL